MTNTLKCKLESDLVQLIQRRARMPGAINDPNSPQATRETDAEIEYLRDRLGRLCCY